jgi:hypothetical protein
MAVLVLASGLSLAAPPAQATPPAVGTCLTYSADQWLQTEFTASLVDCATGHNGEVMGLVTIPADIEATGYGSSAMRAWAFRACQAVSVDYIWRKGTPRYPKASIVLPRTARLTVQIPTGQQWAEGDRWAACLGQNRNVKLSAAQTRTGSVRAQGVRPFVCHNPRGWKGIDCRKPDAVKLTHQVWLPTRYDSAFPGSTKLLKRTQKSCQKLRRKGDTLRTWFVPGLSAWDRGNRYGFCEFVN